MGTLRAPEPDRYAICAYESEPIKEFYKGFFEEVFIFFHPFIKPLTIDTKLHYPAAYIDFLEIKNNCENITWKEFLTYSGIRSYAELDIGLRTYNKKYKNEKTVEIIKQTCDRHNLMQPSEGIFPETIINDLFLAIKNQNYDFLWVGDEHCSERKLEIIDELIKDETLTNHKRNLFTPDKSILVTTHWDSHFTMICSDNKKKIENIVTSCKLEGFYCDNNTKIYWSIYNPDSISNL